MKFDISIEIDWIEEDGSIDNEIKYGIVQSLTKKVTDQISESATNSMIETVKKMVQAQTEKLVYGLLEKPITINNGWNNNTDYPSIYDMVETRMTELYKGKLSTDGKCEKDPLLARIEKFVERETAQLLNKVESKIERHSALMARKAVDENKLIKSIQTIIGK
ncbi:MAG: hypothetical protein E3J56_14270 [Candidatus Aminicenantes bacterium]|nr:MAG: hypothetical protein E3J56_14270 [Candidatus Aminicenantes bacterium]